MYLSVICLGLIACSLAGADRNPRFPAFPVEFQTENRQAARSKACVTGNGCPGQCLSRCSNQLPGIPNVKCETGGFFGGAGVCCPENQRSEKISFENDPLCGKPGNLHYVVGGIDSEAHAKPWMVQLYQVNPRNPAEKRYICTSSLINNRWILTAAHCVVRQGGTLAASNFVVKVGAHTFADGEFQEVDQVYAHENYRDMRHYDDIALIRLAKPVTYSETVRPVCLPTNEMIARGDIAGDKVIVSGWGTTTYGGNLPKVLQEAEVEVIDRKECSKNYSKMPGAMFMLPQGIDKTMICAGLPDGKKDTCQGDSGGPLMFPQGDRVYQIGVVSFGYKCAEPGFPGVYSNVYHNFNWIACKTRAV